MSLNKALGLLNVQSVLSKHGVFVVYLWCTCGVLVVYLWCTCGVFVVYLWCTCGVLVYFHCRVGYDAEALTKMESFAVFVYLQALF